MERTLGPFIYNAFWRLLRPCLAALAKRQTRLQPQFLGRDIEEAELTKWAARRVKRSRSVIFFCSSAGEYEQAKPLAARLGARYDAYVAYIFASNSGVRFAKSQAEANDYRLAPWDQPDAWRRIFESLRPDFVVVVRYELWPGFLHVASRVCPIYLVDAVASQRIKRSLLTRSVWRRLLRNVQHIFPVGPLDLAFYRESLQVPIGRLSIAGDTKYDRVLERLEERADKLIVMRSELASFLGQSRCLILGSAWPKDLDALLSVWQELRNERGPFKLIVAPHDVSPAMAEYMQHSLQDKGLQVCRVTEKGLSGAREQDDVLLVDRIGILPELYGCVDVAWIGGAMHYRVHNVLEAACRGLYVCFGPHYHSSQEAIRLVSEGLAQVVTDGPSFAEWFRHLSWEHEPPHQQLWQLVAGQRGASERILASILGGSENPP